MSEISNNIDKPEKPNILARFFDYVTEYYQEALKFYQDAKLKMRDVAQTNYDLGIYHMRHGNISDAILRFKIVTFLKKDHVLGYYHHARCLMALGKNHQAIELFTLCLKLQPQFQEVEYMLAVLGERPHPNDIPVTVVEDFFDEFAQFYEQDLVGDLHYKGPALLFESLATNLPIAEIDASNMLDLGCGTGLCGKYFKEHMQISYLVGVDVSACSLALAKTTTVFDLPIYDNLVKDNITHYLSNCHKKFNIITACYSLHYSSLLGSHLKNCAQLLSPGGILVFSVRKSANNEDQCFSPNMETFCFSRPFVAALIKEAGFSFMDVSEGMISDHETSLQCVCRI